MPKWEMRLPSLQAAYVSLPYPHAITEEEVSFSFLTKVGPFIVESVKFIKAPNIPYMGSHHSKMILLFSNHGLRVVVSSANNIRCDWEVATNGVWVSPLFPLITPGKEVADAPLVLPSRSGTGFGHDFIVYLKSYRKLDHLCLKVAAHDMSDASM